MENEKGKKKRYGKREDHRHGEGRKRGSDRKPAFAEKVYKTEDPELTEKKKMLEDLMKEPAYVPLKLKELAILLDVPRERRKELQAVLDELLSEGRISISAKGKYGKADLFAVAGTFCGSQKGFGFVTVEGRDEDVFIPGKSTNGAMHGDKVKIVIEEASNGRREEGIVV